MISYTREELIDTLGLLLAQQKIINRKGNLEQIAKIQDWINEVAECIKEYKEVA